ncbi:MAG: hypothetical protein JSR31_13580 [Nitrospira sp.]|nr:hypothetical protein [Nitrospira sp.]
MAQFERCNDENHKERAFYLVALHGIAIMLDQLRQDENTLSSPKIVSV